jgi:hypothetical protein
MWEPADYFITRNLEQYNFRGTDSKHKNCWNCRYCAPGYHTSKPEQYINRCSKYGIEVREHEICDQYG